MHKGTYIYAKSFRVYRGCGEYSGGVHQRQPRPQQQQDGWLVLPHVRLWRPGRGPGAGDRHGEIVTRGNEGEGRW